MMTFVPQITTPAGACLTQDNWGELGIDYAVCSLSSLLMKPGLSYLLTLSDLREYLGWAKHLVLDASMLILTAAEHFMIQSVYDGTRTTVSMQQFWMLVHHLRPHIVLLPPGVQAKEMPQFASLTLPFFPFDTGANTYAGLYGLYGTAADWAKSSTSLRTASVPLYIKDDEGFLPIQELAELQTQIYYASDKPAMDACQGLVYQQGETVSIVQKQYAFQFEPLEADCACSTCKQGLTRAYLHHLFQSTPLLCQRLLIIHNMFWFQKVSMSVS